jgi:hypothetical protein
MAKDADMHLHGVGDGETVHPLPTTPRWRSQVLQGQASDTIDTAEVAQKPTTTPPHVTPNTQRRVLQKQASDAIDAAVLSLGQFETRINADHDSFSDTELESDDDDEGIQSACLPRPAPHPDSKYNENNFKSSGITEKIKCRTLDYQLTNFWGL